MTTEQIRKLCLSLPGTTEEILWQNDLVFKVAGKMFAVVGLDNDSRYSFKCSGDDFYDLTESPGIRRAPYLARAKWIQIDPKECELDDTRIENLIQKSYALVVAKLPKKVQSELG